MIDIHEVKSVGLGDQLDPGNEIESNQAEITDKKTIQRSRW